MTEEPHEHCPNTPLVEARDLSRRDPQRSTWLLDAITFRVHAGERIAVVGPTGSGKTLLLRSLALLDAAHSGAVLWNGRPVLPHQVPEYRSRVMYVHQRPVLPRGTVEACLRQPFELKVYSRKRFDEALAINWLQTAGRDAAFLAKASSDLSGGERQLTALFRALQLDPSVLLLDEPTAALDAKATQGVEELLSRWLDEKRIGRAIVWVGHSAEQVQRVADRAVHLESGRLTGEAPS